MPKPDMNAMLKRRMAATQQASELQVGNEVYEKLFEPVPASSPMIRDLPVDKLRPFFTADIGFYPYPKDKLVAFSKQLAEEGLLERIIVRRIAGSDSYEILAGHNRTAAWRLTGNTTISAEIVNADDARAIIIATATNLLRRQDLTIIERGKAYKAMLDTGRPPGTPGVCSRIQNQGGNRMKQILCINLAAALAFACAGFLWKWRTQVK